MTRSDALAYAATLVLRSELQDAKHELQSCRESLARTREGLRYYIGGEHGGLAQFALREAKKEVADAAKWARRTSAALDALRPRRKAKAATKDGLVTHSTRGG